ncbi:MAG: decarboxylating 6-phosphogluconate dehydrogenase [Peptococcaceae bacterium]|nr:decarboxylating 6-phosphogluconate dehydrogenase [Peptococcaceae bacterium]
MQIGMVGLGRMGMNMGRRLLQGDHRVWAYNRTGDKVAELVREGASGAASLEELVQGMEPPRVVWLMLPAGKITGQYVTSLGRLLAPGDILVDGGNGSYRDDPSRASQMASFGVDYVDAGVSGGVWGLRSGYCIMVGGTVEAFRRLEPILKTLAAPEGYLYCGGVGAGHFLKMVHNGIEYAMLEAYGEGFEILKASPYWDGLAPDQVAALWNRGSVIRSWLLELLESAFRKDPGLSSVAGYVEDSGEGRWTVMEAVESGVAAPGIAMALFRRFQSRQGDLFSDRVIAALRREFGGHAVLPGGETGGSAD